MWAKSHYLDAAAPEPGAAVVVEGATVVVVVAASRSSGFSGEQHLRDMKCMVANSGIPQSPEQFRVDFLGFAVSLETHASAQLSEVALKLSEKITRSSGDDLTK